MSSLDIEVDIEDLILIKEQLDGCTYSPIPLTEEWLIKLGFEKSISTTGPPINEELESYILDGYDFMKDRCGSWFLCGYNWNTTHFQYVHQIQNLYFALTGEELKIETVETKFK